MAEKIEFPIKHKTLINKDAESVFRLISTSEGWDSWFTHGSIFDPKAQDCFLNWKGWGADNVDMKAKVEILEINSPRTVRFKWNFGLAGGPTTVTLSLLRKNDSTELSVDEIGYENTAEGREALIECSTGWGEAITLIKVFAEHQVSYN